MQASSLKYREYKNGLLRFTKLSLVKWEREFLRPEQQKYIRRKTALVPDRFSLILFHFLSKSASRKSHILIQSLIDWIRQDIDANILSQIVKYYTLGIVINEW